MRKCVEICHNRAETMMNGLIYLAVGLVVVIMFILSFLGLSLMAPRIVPEGLEDSLDPHLGHVRALCICTEVRSSLGQS